MLAEKKVTNSNQIFLTENVGKLIIKFSIPVIISLLVAEMYNMIDSLFVGQVIGAKGIAALTIAFPVQRLFQAISMLVAIGASTAVARCCGENDYSKIKRIIPNAFLVLIVMLLFLTAGTFIFRDALIVKLGASEAVFPYAKEYISIILFGVLFQGLVFLISYILNSFGNSKIILYSTLIGAVCNFILDYIFVSIFSLAIEGAAFATALSQLISFIYAFKKFMELKKYMNISFNFKLDKSIYKGILFVGFSTFVIEISDAVVAVFLNKILAEMGGDMAIVAVGLITRISMFMFINIIGISSAMQPIAAYNYGAENYDRVRKIVRYSTKLVSISSILFWIVIMIFTRELLGIFVNDKEIIDYTVNAFRIVVSILPCVGIYYVVIYYYQAMGMAKLSVLLSIFRQIIVFIPLVYILVYGFNLGVAGAWIAYPVSDVISFFIAIMYIKIYHLEEKEKVLIKDKSAVAAV
ncbi:multidrug export protein MepA [Clostridium homopropionicum DSM 5847]|uniref:Multidrug export protein MepA n=1 Tax=Clostridium homopropionicum DSM 5847 TaxID=1121318 RepID=A0A0L6ZAI6_9CLOT|nr:MATE family efflux transporter [Clostridium homopropionicum]KOA19985.1 multidrug export protein MepA [Clostridium homopropionicum DSM 5847]SFG63980.1 putative efflux protein, MATE family [Clostridium homopropionicum]